MSSAVLIVSALRLNEPFDEMTVRLIDEKTVRVSHKDDFGLPCEAEKNVAGVVLAFDARKAR